jgi:hypothetical protein
MQGGLSSGQQTGAVSVTAYPGAASTSSTTAPATQQAAPPAADAGAMRHVVFTVRGMEVTLADVVMLALALQALAEVAELYVEVTD